MEPDRASLLKAVEEIEHHVMSMIRSAELARGYLVALRYEIDRLKPADRMDMDCHYCGGTIMLSDKPCLFCGSKV